MDEQSKIAGSDDPVSKLCEFQGSLLWDHLYSGPETEYPLKTAVCNMCYLKPGCLEWESGLYGYLVQLGVRRELRARMQ